MALLAGGNIAGGRMLGGFHGLADQALHENRDLPVLVDWRDLLSDAMHRVYGLNKQNLDEIFPGRSGKTIS
jgi:uncharacterized protein (DUF1501 family)